jgi:hypothetical protein
LSTISPSFTEPEIPSLNRFEVTSSNYLDKIKSRFFKNYFIITTTVSPDVTPLVWHINTNISEETAVKVFIVPNIKMEKQVSPTYRFRSPQLHGMHHGTLIATRITDVKHFNNIFSSISGLPN